MAYQTKITNPFYARNWLINIKLNVQRPKIIDYECKYSIYGGYYHTVTNQTYSATVTPLAQLISLPTVC